MLRVLFLFLLVSLYIFSSPLVAYAGDNNPPAENRSCLDTIKSFNEKYGFKNGFDKANKFDVDWDLGFSCYLGVNAQSVQNSIEAFQNAIIFPHKDNIVKGVKFPFRINRCFTNQDSKEVRIINDWEEFLEFRNTQLNNNHIALIACASIKTLRIIPDDGAMLGNGFIWFQSREEGFGPWIMNAQMVTDKDILTECKQNN